MKLNRNMDDGQLARAFYEDAREKGQLNVVFDNMMDVRQILQNNPDLGAFFDNKAIEKANKEQVMHDLLQNFTELTKSFVHTIYDYQMMSGLNHIVNEFEKVYDYHNRTVVAKVTTAIPLTEEQKQRLTDAFAKKMRAKKVIFNEFVKPEILGGVIIETEDQVIDGSVRFNFEKLKKQIL
ncbi:ATP synthase F1 subunit delta [Desemzia sp. FAM 23991]|uniref:ATP synthase F1 subunit delta n=1 Tax=unclassified Desemzia TaxID=2685243 RepID=UPI003885AEA5